MILLVSFLVIWAAFHSIDQIAVNRNFMTYLPGWVWDSRVKWLPFLPWLNLDGFHVFKEFGQYAFGAFAVSLVWNLPYILQEIPFDSFWDSLILLFVIVWLVKGFLFNAFYHIIWIKRDFWTWPIPFTTYMITTRFRIIDRYLLEIR